MQSNAREFMSHLDLPKREGIREGTRYFPERLLTGGSSVSTKAWLRDRKVPESSVGNVGH
jgi:hypothetical protein